MISPALLGAIAAAPTGGSGSFNGMVGWTDFSEHDPFVSPVPDWTHRWAAIDGSAGVELHSRIITQRSLSGQVLLIDTETTGFGGSFRGVSTWDIPGILPATDIEVLVLCRGWMNGMHGAGIAEGLAPSGGLYTPDLMQAINITNQNTNPRHRDFQKARTANSWGASTFTDSGAPAAVPSFARHFIRFRRTSTKRWRAKIWQADLAEPGAWQHDVASDATLEVASGGLPGIMFTNWAGSGTSPLVVEYLAVSTSPDVEPAPMPESLDLQGGNFGVVDMTTAAVAADQFVNYPLNGTILTPVVEARVGSKHGYTLRVTAAAAGPRGIVGWVPGGYLINGDVLALLDVGPAQQFVLGGGVVYPKAANGSGYYVKAHRSFACLRDFANAVAWMANKDKDDSTDFPLRTNVTGVTINNNEKWWVRHRRENQHNIKCRFWKDGTAEPSTWSVDQTSQYQHDPVGWPAMGYDLGVAAGSLYLEHMAWTDDPTTNPVDPV